MHLIVCVDARGGMAFNCRRLSSDKVLAAKICDITQGAALWVSPYSVSLFKGTEACLHVSEDYLSDAASGEYCFAEREDLTVLAQPPESVILCLWNRCYPADTYFPQKLLEGATCQLLDEFPGSSHEKISIERYVL